MNILYLINHFIFSSFFTLFAAEVGIALILLFSYKNYDKLRTYLMPMWEINGTFAILYIVSFEAIYPQLLPTIVDLYLIPVMLAALLFILRNAFLSYSENVGASKKKLYVKIYSIITILISFIIISIFSSALSGIKINLSGQVNNIIPMLFNNFNILMFFSVALISFYSMCIVLSINYSKKVALITLILSIFIGAYAILTYTSYLTTILFSGVFLALICLTLIGFIITLISFIYQRNTLKKLMLPTFFLLIFTISIAQYPFIFGNKMQINQYLTSGVNTIPIIYITIIGMFFVSISIGYLIYIHNKPIKHKKSQNIY